MLKDDKMMSLLTVVVIMVAVGTMVQRLDVFKEYFGDGATEELAHVRDEAIVRANALSPIDVLGNDTGLSEDDAAKLIIVDQPACGRVFARNGVAEYLPAERCVGQQRFTYAISGRGGGKTGEVLVTVRLGELTQAVVAADAQLDIPAPRPQAPGAAEQATATAPPAPTAPDGQSTAALDATVQAPSVPQPSAPAIGSLAETAPSVAAGDSGAGAEIAREGAEMAPRLAVTPDPLSGGLASTGAPALPLPNEAGVRGESGVGQGAAQSAGQPAGQPLQVQPPALPGQSGRTQTLVIQPTPQAGSDAERTATLERPTVRLVLPGQSGGEGAGANADQAAGAEDGSVLRAAPTAPTGASDAEGAPPAEALAALRGGAPAELAPVNTAPPPGLGDGQRPAVQAPARQPAAPVEACDTPPSLTLDVRPAAITYAIIESPCHKGTVAELSYSGVSFAISIDSSGTGTIAAPGFEKASDATLTLAGGTQIAFNIPFSDIEKMDRVALVSHSATELELHAFEFGAAPGSPGHVGPQNPRHYAEVRRTGGGYMLTYVPIDGLGQAITVYTFWHRRRGTTGVAKLDLGIGATRPGAPSCADGAVIGAPDFVVLRSHAGRLERPELGVLAPMDCAALASGGDGFVADAIGDMIVRPR